MKAMKSASSGRGFWVGSVARISVGEVAFYGEVMRILADAVGETVFPFRS